MTGIVPLEQAFITAATRNGQLHIVEDCIARGVDVDMTFGDKQETALVAVASVLWENRRDFMKLLLDAGANPNGTDMDGKTALHRIAYESRGHNADRNHADFLIYRGARLDARDSTGATPLHAAVTKCLQANHMELVNYLLAKGADITARDNAGRTPLDIAEQGTGPSRVSLIYFIGEQAKKNEQHTARQRKAAIETLKTIRNTDKFKLKG
ncbi:MAG: ankyrin repeat domain-containing protein [Micavibrio sp.]|nr:ankyrin repeat domain-containing protein [Micavibrio sp.]